LDTREYSGKDPLRVVLVGDKELNPNQRVLTDGKPTLIIGRKPGNLDSEIPEFFDPLNDDLAESALKALYEKGISSVIVEGGAFTLQHFLETRIWDEARIIQSSRTLEGGLPAPKIPFEHTELIHFGRDKVFFYRNK
jgi:diaminohydroxyphosphoribosylaminopyrimidine deaminase/5-amino-6-(5-phosphoribosylamino)uracil reductase